MWFKLQINISNIDKIRQVILSNTNTTEHSVGSVINGTELKIELLFFFPKSYQTKLMYKLNRIISIYSVWFLKTEIFKNPIFSVRNKVAYYLQQL